LYGRIYGTLKKYINVRPDEYRRIHSDEEALKALRDIRRFAGCCRLSPIPYHEIKSGSRILLVSTDGSAAAIGYFIYSVERRIFFDQQTNENPSIWQAIQDTVLVHRVRSVSRKKGASFHPLESEIEATHEYLTIEHDDMGDLPVLLLGDHKNISDRSYLENLHPCTRDSVIRKLYNIKDKINSSLNLATTHLNGDSNYVADLASRMPATVEVLVSDGVDAMTRNVDKLIETIFRPMRDYIVREEAAAAEEAPAVAAEDDEEPEDVFRFSGGNSAVEMDLPEPDAHELLTNRYAEDECGESQAAKI
jgi:hypothetical protein